MLNFFQIAAYEREINKLREELLKEINHLEERKEEAVKAAASCSAEHFQNLQDQFFSRLREDILGPLTQDGSVVRSVFLLVRPAEATDSTPSNFTLHEDGLRQSEEPSSKLL